MKLLLEKLLDILEAILRFRRVDCCLWKLWKNEAGSLIICK